MGCHTEANSVAKFFQKKGTAFMWSSGLPSVSTPKHFSNVLLTSVMVILSEGAGITALSISVHLLELSENQHISNFVLRLTGFNN